MVRKRLGGRSAGLPRKLEVTLDAPPCDVSRRRLAGCLVDEECDVKQIDDLGGLSERAHWARRVLALLDLTDLSESSSPTNIESLCAAARDPLGSVAAVCVWPRRVAQSGVLLEGTGIKVATVVNFPAGTDRVDEVLADTELALAAGADEIDLVLPWRAFLSGDVIGSRSMVTAVRNVVGPTHLLKVILETGLYPDQDSVGRAAHVAIDAGADFLKTSTGKTPVSATPAAVSTLLHVIRSAHRSVGIKPSGGIRTLGDAVRFLAMADEIMGRGWATPGTFRFGASAVHAALIDILRADTDPVALPETG
jgi:deoxyribose-phosphate aldolase